MVQYGFVLMDKGRMLMFSIEKGGSGNPYNICTESKKMGLIRTNSIFYAAGIWVDKFYSFLIDCEICLKSQVWIIVNAKLFEEETNLGIRIIMWTKSTKLYYIL